MRVVLPDLHLPERAQTGHGECFQATVQHHRQHENIRDNLHAFLTPPLQIDMGSQNHWVAEDCGD